MFEVPKGQVVQFGFKMDLNREDKLPQPIDIAILPTKNLVAVTERYYARVNLYKLREANGALSGTFMRSFGGKGKEDGQLYFPRGICEDVEGHMLVCDTLNARVSQFDIDGNFIKHVLTRPAASEAEEIEQPTKIACDKDNRYLAVVFAYLGKCVIRVFKYRTCVRQPSESQV